MSGLLTIGMACANDWQGLWSTLKDIRNHNNFMGEIVVVNNAPTTNEGKSVEAISRNFRAKHIAFDKEHGTSSPRNEVFAQATNEWVLCMDSHVEVQAIPALITKLKSGEVSGTDLFTGPIIMNWREGFATHFRDEWGEDHMWGKWGLAWAHHTNRSEIFDVAELPGGKAGYFTVTMNPKPIESVGGMKIPLCDYAGHQKYLQEAGFLPVGALQDDPPVEIPAQGLGLFLSRRDSWLGFHPLARGFGGEEHTIHEYYRDHGRKVICLPWLKWDHRFAADKTNPGYRLQNWDRARNYALSVGRLKRKDELMPRARVAMIAAIGLDEWNKIEANPAAEQVAACGTCGGGTKKESVAPFGEFNTSDMLSWVKNQKRDFDQQVDNVLASLSGCETVTNIVKRREWDVAACYSGAKVTSYNREVSKEIRERLLSLYGDKFVPQSAAWPAKIQDTDALILDTAPTGDRIFGDLETFAKQVKKRILIHATHIHGESGEGPAGTSGLLIGLRGWLKLNPEWKVVLHSTVQFGLTVISRDPADVKPLPGIVQQGINYANAMAAHLKNGLKIASEEVISLRLETCSLCPIRNNENCSACGCNLASKSSLDSSECPLGYWAASETAGKPIVPPASIAILPSVSSVS